MSNNYSKQREIILEVIKNTRIHPTIEEIYEMVKKVDYKISKSTVYRNVKILAENDAIKKITMQEGPDRFDYIHIPHHHIVCEICRKVFDFKYNFDMKKISKSIKEQTGVFSNMDCITINGICENCKSKK